VKEPGFPLSNEEIDGFVGRSAALGGFLHGGEATNIVTAYEREDQRAIECRAEPVRSSCGASISIASWPTQRAMAEALNARGIPTPRARKWEAMSASRTRWRALNPFVARPCLFCRFFNGARVARPAKPNCPVFSFPAVFLRSPGPPNRWTLTAQVRATECRESL
jgi:hypothetical protein